MQLETSLSNETKPTDAQDGVQDIILAVGSSLLKLSKGNIESLKLITFLKNTLKRLKSFLFLIDLIMAGRKTVGRIALDQRWRLFQRKQQAAQRRRIRS